MTLEERQQAYQKFIDNWGVTQQLVMVLEECSELQKEITKYIRGNGNLSNLEEEIADVEIMLEQLKYIFNLTSIDVMKQIKIARAMRTLERDNG